jgi:DMSO/TMAO reductase YedYZ molybdopterin-dependent catalytic subunit
MMQRRNFLTAAAAMGLSGCKVLDSAAKPGGAARGVLMAASGLTYRTQRLLGGDALAPEFTMADIRQGQKPNGTINPSDADYQTLASAGFSDWRLEVVGAVERPLRLSLADLQAMPARSQITRHDCVEGWSCIAKWTGVQLSRVLDQARPTHDARFVVFHCMDTIERSLSGLVKYYESIDLRDAVHPQTILAYGLNDAPLPVANGAPLRVRVERQLGYKMAKYLHKIELVAGVQGLGDGNGSYWADRGYEWYAGI